MLTYFPSFFLFIQGGSRAGLRGGGHNFLFHVKSFLTLLFTIGNIAVWGAMDPRIPRILPCVYLCGHRNSIPLPSLLHYIHLFWASVMALLSVFHIVSFLYRIYIPSNNLSRSNCLIATYLSILQLWY